MSHTQLHRQTQHSTAPTPRVHTQTPGRLSSHHSRGQSGLDPRPAWGREFCSTKDHTFCLSLVWELSQAHLFNSVICDFALRRRAAGFTARYETYSALASSSALFLHDSPCLFLLSSQGDNGTIHTTGVLQRAQGAAAEHTHRDKMSMVPVEGRMGSRALRKTSPTKGPEKYGWNSQRAGAMERAVGQKKWYPVWGLRVLLAPPPVSPQHCTCG